VLARLPERGDFLATVRATIADCLRLGDVSIEHTAKRLALTPRTLQRRLTDAGQVYRQLVEDVRCVAARTYLARTDLSLQEVSDLLAFSEQSAFQRAFRRWTEQSPQAYRRAQQDAQRAETAVANQRVAVRARS
jgi:AraC-like DNA-binding protein